MRLYEHSFFIAQFPNSPGIFTYVSHFSKFLGPENPAHVGREKRSKFVTCTAFTGFQERSLPKNRCNRFASAI